jgi:hypothetical protein
LDEYAPLREYIKQNVVNPWLNFDIETAIVLKNNVTDRQTEQDTGSREKRELYHTHYARYKR